MQHPFQNKPANRAPQTLQSQAVRLPPLTRSLRAQSPNPVQNNFSSPRILHSFFALLGALMLLSSPDQALGQGGLTLANPHWNITLTDAGYSDFLLDNTPGFEGREYLSGEWGAAVGYQLAGGTVVAPQWLERQFVFPDWTNNSTFQVVTPLTQTALNADNLPIAQAVIANSHLEITLRHEMLDTVVGTPMGETPASAANPGRAIHSSRYVLKQTATVKNISGSAIPGIQFIQLLHGLTSQRGVYDNRSYPGSLSNFQFDVTLAGVDAAAVGAGSSTEGLEDYIGFHASAAPSAFELGYYGIEGNGVDDHGSGKPSDGVHLSIEDNWLTPPYSTRQGTDNFAPSQRWVAGAQRWELGALATGQSVSFDVILSLRTGTKVAPGTGSSGGCNGGSSVPGGVDYEFEDVTSDGSCFGEYSQADENEIALRIDEGEFGPFNFLTPGGPAQLWKMQFTGTSSGNVNLKFGYDPTILPPGFDESLLSIYEFTGGAWQKLDSLVSLASNTIAVTAANLSVFALGVDALATYAVDASAAPANSGTINGDGAYAEGSSVSLVAVANPGYVFTNWTENASEVSTSPSYTFLAQADRTLVANFVAVGAARSITTRSLPANGGSTSGDGAYAPGSDATVSATANPGYKFSKWQVNGVSVSTARNYTFTVTDDRALIAKFKPVYSVVVSAEPADGGEVEADPFYESGELAKLKAKPSTGYAFVNWTQNGTPISTVPNFQFNVTGNRELVGNFALGNRIDVSAEPVNAGLATGGGIHSAGANVNLVATANPGYVFLKWTENGVPVSTSQSYTLTSDNNHTLVANFIAQPTVSLSPGAPDTLLIAWPVGASGWELQECTDLGLGDWMNSARTVSVVGNQKQVTITPPIGNGFFRLVHP